MAEGPNILINPGFEAGLTGWTNIGLVTHEVVAGQYHGVADDAGDTMQQSGLNFIASDYNLNGFLQVVSGTVRILCKGVWVVQKGVGTYNLDETFNIDAPGTSTLQFFMPNAGTTEFYLDNLVLSVVYEGSIPVGRVTLSLIDYDKDRRQFSLPIAESSAGTYTADLAAVNALRDAVLGISKCELEARDFVASRQETGNAPPSAASAQINIEWKVTYIDDVTGGVETVRIPGADLDIANVLLPGSNVADLTVGAMSTFVTAFEAVVLSDAGNAVSVQQIEFLE